MDAWMVGRHPIAFMNAPVSGEYDTAQYNKSKVKNQFCNQTPQFPIFTGVFL